MHVETGISAVRTLYVDGHCTTSYGYLMCMCLPIMSAPSCLRMQVVLLLYKESLSGWPDGETPHRHRRGKLIEAERI